ncbi:hypothetical protein, partial [Escherichia coli]
RLRFSGPKTSIICSPMTSLKTSIKTITYLSDIGCLEIQGASLGCQCIYMGWFVYPPGIMRDIINFNTNCAIVFHACPPGRLFSACRKKSPEKTAADKKEC